MTNIQQCGLWSDKLCMSILGTRFEKLIIHAREFNNIRKN